MIVVLATAACQDPITPLRAPAGGALNLPGATGNVLAAVVVNGFTITLRQLPDLVGAQQSAAGWVNASGTIVGSATINGYSHPVLWPPNATAPVDLGLPPGILYASAHHIADSGAVIGGTAFMVTSLGTPIQFRPAPPRILPSLVTTGVATAAKINNAGVAVGSARNYTVVRQYERPVRWVNGIIEDLGVPSGMTVATAFGINSAGDIVGQAANLTTTGHKLAYRWRNGTFTILPTLGSPVGHNIAYFVHDNGDIVGSSSDAFGGSHAAVWRNGAVIDLGNAAPGTFGLRTEAFAINRQGLAVGQGWVNGRQVPLLFANGQIIPLPLPAAAAVPYGSANAINDAGTIVGSGYVDANYSIKGLVWTVSGGGGGGSPPIARIVAPSQGVEGSALGFSGATSTDADGDTLTYHWDFGDGTTASVVAPNHSYLDNGTYTVTLTARDPGGLTGSAAKVVTIGNAAPTVSVRATTATTIGVGGSVTYRLTIRDAGASDQPWRWRVAWGDGTTSSGSRTAVGAFTLSHRYNIRGRFVATVSVLDKDGATGGASGPAVTVQ